MFDSPAAAAAAAAAGSFSGVGGPRMLSPAKAVFQRRKALCFRKRKKKNPRLFTVLLPVAGCVGCGDQRLTGARRGGRKRKIAAFSQGTAAAADARQNRQRLYTPCAGRRRAQPTDHPPA